MEPGPYPGGTRAVVSPTTDRLVVRERSVVKAKRAQATILEQLGIEPPRRMRMRGPTLASSLQ
jgi:hypothetical protein